MWLSFCTYIKTKVLFYLCFLVFKFSNLLCSNYYNRRATNYLGIFAPRSYIPSRFDTKIESILIGDVFLLLKNVTMVVIILFVTISSRNIGLFKCVDSDKWYRKCFMLDDLQFLWSIRVSRLIIEKISKKISIDL